MAWATTADVLALTGVTAMTPDVTRAQGIIDLYCGVTEDVEDLSARDTRLLQAAVCYQAAWMAGQVDVMTRTEVASLEQDGVKVTPTDADALFLAPLARRALSGLSWNRRTRTHHVAPTGVRQFATLEDFRDAWMADEAPSGWRPIEGWSS